MAEFGRGYVTIVPVYERGAQASVEKFARKQATGYSTAFNKALTANVAKTGTTVGKTLSSTLGAGVKAVKVGLKAATTAAVTTAAGVGLVSKALSGGWQRAATIDTATKRMQALGLSAETSSKAVSLANDKVTGTVYTLPDAANMVSLLAASGRELTGSFSSVDSTLNSLITASTLAGKNDLSEMGDVFVKIANSGKIMGNELYQLQRNGVAVYPILSRYLGKTSEEIREMASNGELSLEMLNRAFASLGTGENSPAKIMGETLPVKIGNAKNAFNRFTQELASPLYQKLSQNGGFFDVLRDKVNSFTKDADGNLNPTIAHLSGSLASLADRGVSALDWLDENDIPTKAINGLADAFEDLGTAIDEAKGSYDSFNSWFKDLTGQSFGETVGNIVDSVISIPKRISGEKSYAESADGNEQWYMNRADNLVYENISTGEKRYATDTKMWSENTKTGERKTIYEDTTIKPKVGSVFTQGTKQAINKDSMTLAKMYSTNFTAGVNKNSAFGYAMANAIDRATNSAKKESIVKGKQTGLLWNSNVANGISTKKGVLIASVQNAINSTSGVSTAVANQKGAQYTTGVQAGINSRPRPSITIDLKKGSTLLWNAFSSIKGTGVLATAAKNALMSGYVSLMAKGGVVNSPHLALFGEAGTEAVVPLERNTQWIHKVANDMSGSLNGFGNNGAPNLYINNAQVNSSKYIEQAFYNLMQATARKGYM